MAWFSRGRPRRGAGPVLEVERLDVYYGRAHALQEVSLILERGVIAVVGRNGMGKTTLCNAITGLVPASGRVRLAGQEILGLPPHAITERGVGYVIIEHDLDVALRVVERVTVLHNGRVLKHGTPAEIEGDAEVQAIYIGGGRAHGSRG